LTLQVEEMRVMRQSCGVLLLLGVTLCVATPVQAQSGSDMRRCDGATASTVASGTVHGLLRMPDPGSLTLLGAAAGAAVAARPADRRVTDAFRNDPDLRPVFRPGATIGSMPFEAGAAAALMSIGRTSGHPCLASLGSDLLQAQLVGAAWTIAVKELVRRDRPEGTGFSFPSGHTATAFASATVFQRRFGWKAGIPAYAVASYVAASRVNMQRHYLSDVIVGAAVGVVAGRTVTVGRQRWEIGPIATTSGAGVGFSLLPSR
jgi:membrane-associated phospholipid phosphatase